MKEPNAAVPICTFNAPLIFFCVFHELFAVYTTHHRYRINYRCNFDAVNDFICTEYLSISALSAAKYYGFFYVSQQRFTVYVFSHLLSFQLFFRSPSRCRRKKPTLHPRQSSSHPHNQYTHSTGHKAPEVQSFSYPLKYNNHTWKRGRIFTVSKFQSALNKSYFSIWVIINILMKPLSICPRRKQHDNTIII